MSHCRYPVTAIRRTLYHDRAAVRHPNAPLALIAARVRQVHTVHHVILVSVDVLIAQAADIVHLRYLCSTVLVLVYIPGILVHSVLVHQTVCHIRVDCLCALIAYGVLHASRHRAASRAHIRMRASATLLLHVPPAILRVCKVRNAEVHQSVNLLHTPLHAVIVEVRPCHACCSAAARYAGTQLAAHNRTAHNSAQMLIVRKPFRLHILYLAAVG